jgi:histidine ammonia-lyase/phenylalanine ammonia-lyase
VSQVVAVARTPDAYRLDIDGDAVARMEASRQLKQHLIDNELPIYGVTTGFGDSADNQISSEKAVDLQRNLLRMLHNGTGADSTSEVVRATMMIRANCLARGHSGVRVDIVRQLIAFLEHDIRPRIPERGSVGASGDLVPLGYLAAALTGEGSVYYRGEYRPAAEVLVDCGLTPLVLEAKEGLGLVNGTSFMSAFAVVAIEDAKELAYIADLCTALASQALLGNQGHFDDFIARQKPHPGQMRSADLIRALLVDSRLSLTLDQVLTDDPLPEGAGYHRLNRSVQDRYSVRCGPNFTGVLRDTVDWAERWVSIEINSSNDNPLFDAEFSSVRSGGNFQGGHIAQAMDSLKLAVASVADLLDRQLALIVDEKFSNGLSSNLTAHFEARDWNAGLHHGFKGMQIAAAALTAEALKLTMPASAFSRSTEAHNQDKVSMGSIAARDARTIIELTREVAAIHLLALCQAADLRGVDELSPATRRAYEVVRAKIPYVDQDRPLESDIEFVVELIKSGKLREASDPTAR